MDYTKLASVALELIGKLSVQADDESLGITVATRNMLHRIKNGELVVSEKSAKQTPEKKALSS